MNTGQWKVTQNLSITLGSWKTEKKILEELVMLKILRCQKGIPKKMHLKKKQPVVTEIFKYTQK